MLLLLRVNGQHLLALPFALGFKGAERDSLVERVGALRLHLATVSVSEAVGMNQLLPGSLVVASVAPHNAVSDTHSLKVSATFAEDAKDANDTAHRLLTL